MSRALLDFQTLTRYTLDESFSRYHQTLFRDDPLEPPAAATTIIPAPMSDSSSASLNRIRRRRADNAVQSRAGTAASMMRMYSDDTPGIKVYVCPHVLILLITSDPIVVLVMSLVFIGSVFILHIWGKYARA